VAVPLAFALHIESLRQLRAATRPQEDQTGTLMPRPVAG